MKKTEQPIIRYKQTLTQKLLALYPPNEAKLLAQMLVEFITGLSYPQMVLNTQYQLSKEQENQLEAASGRLLQGEPIQYVTGKAHFAGMELNVSGSVLIPRPETEELTDLIIQSEKDTGMKILDIGTGSGCIAITLMLRLKDGVVTAADISKQAIDVARENAKLLEADIHFLVADTFNFPVTQLPRQDIIVSNPPYIPERDKKEMHENVIGHEPSVALFVPNEDPLKFYRQILGLSPLLLVPGGRIYFEIHEAYGPEVASLAKKLGMRDIEIFKDLNGKDRMFRCVFPG